MITGVGVDLVSISRLTRLLCKVPSLEKNIFSLRERDLPVRSKAGNIAAKEAMVKAGLLNSFKTFSEIEICRELGGAPIAIVKDNTKNLTFQERASIRISISYLNDTALALVVYQTSCDEKNLLDD